MSFFQLLVEGGDGDILQGWALVSPLFLLRCALQPAQRPLLVHRPQARPSA
ncbi:unnamed protein product [Ectocarpus sp. CCAP 1310/34]|nr:unnamed protein product [Ectocarpus sp. CCAP 1310/34]